MSSVQDALACAEIGSVFLVWCRDQVDTIERFCALDCLATAVESGRIIRSGSKPQILPNRPPTRIVQDASACAEIRCLFSVLLGIKDDLLDEFSVCAALCGHVAANESNEPHTSTICRSRTVIKSVIRFVPNWELVAEVWPFQVLGSWGVQKQVYSWFTHGLHTRFACPRRHVNYDLPSVCGTACAECDSTKCLIVPWRGWGHLSRAKPAVFRVPYFGEISDGPLLLRL